MLSRVAAVAAASGSGVLVASLRPPAACDGPPPTPPPRKKVPIMYKSAKAAAAARAKAAAAEEARFHAALAPLRREAETLKKKWDWHEKTSRLPTKSWPDIQPDEEDLPALKTALERCAQRTRRVGMIDEVAWLRDCGDFQFALATGFLALSAHADAQASGRAMYAELAEMGHADGMCGLAMCLSDGTGGPPDMERAIELWRGAVEAHNHDEALYQLGCAYYEGTGVAEDEAEACALWRRAAAQKHRDASYMLGDSLLEGSGCKRDRVEAIPFLRQAGELGHRGARSRYLSLMDDMGQQEIVSSTGQRFTDSSRQSIVKRPTGSPPPSPPPPPPPPPPAAAPAAAAPEAAQ